MNKKGIPDLENLINNRKELLENKEKLNKQIYSLDEDIKLLNDQIIYEKSKQEKEFKNSIPDEVKQWLLDNIKHTRSSCNLDDDNPNNGWNEYEGYAKCPRCALAEYFNDCYLYDEIEMTIEVNFHKIDSF